MIEDDVEKGDDTVDIKDVQKDEKSGMSQSSKDDMGVCVTIILITILAVIVTSIKIVLIDMNDEKYAELFGKNITTTTTTTIPTTQDVVFS